MFPIQEQVGQMMESGIREGDDDNDVLFDPADARDSATFDLIQSSRPAFLPWSIFAAMYIICRRGFSRRRNRSRREWYGLIEATPAVSRAVTLVMVLKMKAKRIVTQAGKMFTAH